MGRTLLKYLVVQRIKYKTYTGNDRGFSDGRIAIDINAHLYFIETLLLTARADIESGIVRLTTDGPQICVAKTLRFNPVTTVYGVLQNNFHAILDSIPTGFHVGGLLLFGNNSVVLD